MWKPCLQGFFLLPPLPALRGRLQPCAAQTSPEPVSPGDRGSRGTGEGGSPLQMRQVATVSLLLVPECVIPFPSRPRSRMQPLQCRLLRGSASNPLLRCCCKL